MHYCDDADGRLYEYCVDGAKFSDPPAPDERMESSWVEHQLATTVDFAPRSRWLTWYLGGLNYQVEHHLFPRMPSTTTPRVREWLEENMGDRYVCPTHVSAVKALYSTPRVFKDAHTLSDPFGDHEVDIEEVRLEMLGLTD